jgi:two-component system, NtrC family, sensor kinase
MPCPAVALSGLKSLTHRLAIRTRCRKTEIEIKVRDNGTGIAPDILPHIFEPFMTTKEHGHGTGLGLAIARGIMERHMGSIEVESELGQGTTFILTLPSQAPDASLVAAAGGGHAR